MVKILSQKDRLSSAMLPPFTEDVLIAGVPVYTAEQTLYTRWGDWFAILVSILAAVGLAGGLLVRLLRPR